MILVISIEKMLDILLLVPSVVSRNRDFDYRKRQAIFLFSISFRSGLVHTKSLMVTSVNCPENKVT